MPICKHKFIQGRNQTFNVINTASHLMSQSSMNTWIQVCWGKKDKVTKIIKTLPVSEVKLSE